MNIIGWLMMRPPILLARSWFLLFFFGSLLFLAERLFIAFSGIPGRSISRFLFLGFYLLPAAFTFWAFSPFFPLDSQQTATHILWSNIPPDYVISHHASLLINDHNGIRPSVLQKSSTTTSYVLNSLDHGIYHCVSLLDER
jgi:hypothetical protein